MELYLIRHGEPEWVLDGLNVVDPPLTGRGHQQAKAMADAVAPVHFDEVLVSPLVRARQTAAPLFAAQQRDEVIEPWLEEIRSPLWHGTPREKAEAAYRDDRARPAAERWSGLEGGEPVRDFIDRIHLGATMFLAERGITKLDHELPVWEIQQPEQRICLVAHAGVNSVLICHLLGLAPTPWEWERFVLGHSSISRIEAIQLGDGWTFCLTAMGIVDHLAVDDRTCRDDVACGDASQPVRNRPMVVVRGVADLRALVAAQRREGAHVGLVPTMGSLHDGHLSLIRRAATECDLVIVSVFVNPTQFNDPNDLAAYPRDEARDVELATGVGAHVVFAPTPEEVYPEGCCTSVRVEGPITETLEGAVRGPAHFWGVATVVAKLLSMTQPDVAFFGQKDAQQCVVVRRLVHDLDLPVRIEVCPTVREPDGLAMSSRNVRLGDEDRRRALALLAGLTAVEDAVARGERDVPTLERIGRAAFEPFEVDVEYFAGVHPMTLCPLQRIDGPALFVTAAPVGPVRLLDNVTVSLPEVV